jgi:hypothetical protein
MKKLLILFVLITFNWQNMQAQCLENRHSTNWYDGWISCSTSPNPISAYGNTHWVKYDLGYTYTLYNTKLWNSNDPSHLNYGIMDYKVDYSTDGTSWTNLGTFTANQASGLSQYEGEFGPSFGGVSARYVLITPTSNYGGSCFGFSEMLFNLDGTLAVAEEELDDFQIKAYPNPFGDTISLIINTTKDEAIQYTIYDILGRRVVQGKSENSNNSITIDTKNIQTGVYFVRIKQGNQEKSIKIIKK